MTAALVDAPAVIAAVPGQDHAVAFLARAAPHPAHAYLFTGPEGSGKRLGMRAFAAAMLCPNGGCGECRACRLALGERHSNMVVLEPTGPDILVGKDGGDQNTARWLVAQAYLTPVEPGRKVMIVLQADRLRVEAADVLLKVLEEPPLDTVFVLMSARPDEIPETVRSRCQEVAFPPLSEAFVVETLVSEGVAPERARLACRLAGGNLGRARRVARDDRGLAFRRSALEAQDMALGASGAEGALAAAEALAAAAKAFRASLAEDLAEQIQPFVDERGRVEEPFRGVARRLEEQHDRRVRRAEREFLDSALLALSSFWRDMVAVRVGAVDQILNLDRPGRLASGAAVDAGTAGRAMGAIEEARADLADETNLNPRLVLERMFLRLNALAA